MFARSEKTSNQSIAAITTIYGAFVVPSHTFMVDLRLPTRMAVLGEADEDLRQSGSRWTAQIRTPYNSDLAAQIGNPVRVRAVAASLRQAVEEAIQVHPSHSPRKYFGALLVGYYERKEPEIRRPGRNRL
jgi:hypothetical protein